MMDEIIEDTSERVSQNVKNSVGAYVSLKCDVGRAHVC